MGFSPDELAGILAKEDLTGFTTPLKGSLGRYIIGLTNNTERTLDLLSSQAEFFTLMFDSITIGGRTDPQSNEVYIDVGTSTDDLYYAMLLGKKYRQQCIRDSVDKVEVYVEYLC